MRAAITAGPGKISVAETADPEARDGIAVIQVAAAGICGTDVHLLHGEFDLPFPLVQGHEISGTIAELPLGYTGRLRHGDFVVAEPVIGCAACYACTRGNYNVCQRLRVLGIHQPGGFAEFVAVPVGNLHPAQGLTDLEGALVEPASIALQAVSRLPKKRPDKAAVLGAGPIGQLIILALAADGVEVMAVDRNEERLMDAARVGAAHLVDSSTQDPAAAIESWTTGDGAGAVIEATGAPQLIELAPSLAANGGHVVLVGLTTKTVNFDPALMNRKDLAVISSCNSVNKFPTAIEIVRDNRNRLSSIITHKLKLDEVPNFFQYLSTYPSDVGKASVRMSLND